MSPSADASGLPDRHASAISQYEQELAALGLAAALGAAHVVCAQLATRTRLQAAAEPTYRNHAKAAFLHAAARFLHQACLVLDPGAAMDEFRDPTAGLTNLEAEQAVGWPQRTITVDEQAVLAEAMSLLASEAAELAAHASEPMGALVKSHLPGAGGRAARRIWRSGAGRRLAGVRCRAGVLVAGTGPRGAPRAGTMGRAARDAGAFWDASPLKSLAPGPRP